jgi:integrase/recombinase XerD
MSVLSAELAGYLALRRSMGFKLRRAEKLLNQFVQFCQTADVEVVTTEVALRWAALPEGASPAWVCLRLGVVRAFSRYLALVDGRSQVVPTNVVPHRHCRATPFLYSADQVQALMAAARSLCSPVRQATFETIVGLLWATGMRVGEALGLNCDDVDLAHGVLTVREAKFGKTRELPLHETTTAALSAYATRRSRWSLPGTTEAFFVSAAGTRVLYCNFHLGFQELVRRAGIEARSATCRPRPHDLRHSFAVRALTGWYRDGVDVEANLPKLSTYLGHVVPAHTYWYLSAAPELLALAAPRLESAEERP